MCIGVYVWFFYPVLYIFIRLIKQVYGLFHTSFLSSNWIAVTFSLMFGIHEYLDWFTVHKNDTSKPSAMEAFKPHSKWSMNNIFLCRMIVLISEKLEVFWCTVYIHWIASHCEVNQFNPSLCFLWRYMQPHSLPCQAHCPPTSVLYSAFPHFSILLFLK